MVKVVGTSSERGTLGASGYIDRRRPQPPARQRQQADHASPGGGAELSLKLSKSQLRQARRALKRKRKVTVFLSVVATDAAGNSAQKRAPRIRVRSSSGRASRAAETRRLLPAGSVTTTFSVSVVRLRLKSARRVRASRRTNA